MKSTFYKNYPNHWIILINEILTRECKAKLCRGSQSGEASP